MKHQKKGLAMKMSWGHRVGLLGSYESLAVGLTAVLPFPFPISDPDRQLKCFSIKNKYKENTNLFL